MFTLRDYDKRDFEALFQLDRLCFDPSIAYSRPELASFIEQRRAFTIVAEWNAAGSNATEGNAADSHELTEAASGSPVSAGKPPRDLPSEVLAESSESRSNPGSELRSGGRAGIHPARPPLAGFVTCHFQRQGYGHIITIDVHPNARRNHVGTLLVNATCERLRKMTAFMVVLEVAVNNHSALAFYDRFGFKRVKVLERYYSRDVDAIFMTKRL